MKEYRLRVCILGASFHPGNMGLGALTAGTIKCVLHRFPQAEIFLLDYGKSEAQYELELSDRTVQVPLFNIRFSKKFYLRNNVAFLFLLSLVLKLLPSQRLRAQLIATNPWLRHIEQADIVVSLAGGDSFSDIYGLSRLLYAAIPQIVVLLLGKRLILLPQTIGPFRGRLAKAIAEFVLNRAELIYSRHSSVPEDVMKLLPPSQREQKLKFCYDVGFLVDPVPPTTLDVVGLDLHRNNRCLVGLNISGLLFIGGYNRQNMFGLEMEYRRLIHSVIDLLIKKKRAIVLLVPHVFGPEEDSESDSVACEKTYRALRAKYRDQIGLLRGRYNQSEIKYAIGLCEFFIGSRLHACIAALSQNVPALPLAYSDKFVGVMETIGIESLVSDARRMSIDDILSKVDRAYDERLVIRGQLERKIPQVKAAVLNLFSELQVERAIASAGRRSFEGDAVFHAERR